MKKDKLIFILTVAAALLWLMSKSINVYQFPVVGAFFEILWLPVLIMLLIVPIISFTFWTREKFSLKSYNLFSLIVSALTVLISAFI